MDVIALESSGFSWVKDCVVVGYVPNEGDGEERHRFWNDMDRVLDRVVNGYRLHSGRFKWMDKR